MILIYIAVPLAILLGAAFVAAFVWAVGQGQYDDLDTPPVKILSDD
jgi:cbb3-type cytochrome oxidase maturation protein